MLDVFKQASKSILAILGQDAFLRGEPDPIKVNIEHGVQVINDDQLVTVRSVATIPLEAEPKVGDRLVHPDGNFVIDAPHQNNGANKRFILRPA